MALYPGQTITATGYVTRLNWVDARAPGLVEQSLGYQSGRLSQGYAVGLLADPIRPNHAQFASLSTRSGGRDGLPVADPEQDWLRPRVHDRMIEEYGVAEVAKLLEKPADDPRNLVGGERIVKIFPAIRHNGDNPEQEYPPGGGAPQYFLTEGHTFWIALDVTPQAIARTAPGWSASVAANGPYEDRAKVARYLSTVVVGQG